MASIPLGPDGLNDNSEPVAKVARALTRFDRESLSIFIMVAVEIIDVLDGDPDREDATDAEDDFAISPLALEEAHGPGCEIADVNEADGDEADVSWSEWTTLPAARRRGGHIDGRNIDEWPGLVLEDTEDDDPDTSVEDDRQGFDPEEDMCLAGDDRICRGSATGAVLVCEDTGPGDADDGEHWAQTDNVPMPRVLSADYDIRNDERTYLGRTNLMSSFRTNGSEVKSADSRSSGRAMPCRRT